MNSVNLSMGFSGFQLHSGFYPYIIPLQLPSDSPQYHLNAHEFLQQLQLEVLEAQDCLLSAKVDQACSSNKHCMLNPKFEVSDKVLLITN
ncbi:hypothetical protein GYMLUDRAFT_108223, partial [Collybiopsis luxurians FD-317 M1]